MFVYKYLNKDRLLEFKEKGSVYINTLQNLRFTEDKNIRDVHEGKRILKVDQKRGSMTFSNQLANNFFPSAKFKGSKNAVEFKAKAHATTTTQVANAYIFCTSLALRERIKQKLGRDAYYRIINPFQFASTVFEELNNHVSLRCFKNGKVKYADEIRIKNSNKNRVLGKDSADIFFNICLSKRLEFMWQKEYRMIFIPLFDREIKPIVISSSKLHKYCTF